MDTQEIIEWLNSDEGLKWSYGRFDDATECHDIIEIHEDYHPDEWWGDARTMSTRRQFRYLRGRAPEWSDLQWTPDQPPEGGKWTKKTRLLTRSSSTASTSK